MRECFCLCGWVCAERAKIAEEKAVLETEEAAANAAAAEAKGMRDECEKNLAIAMPAMEAALRALDTLKTSDIAILKSMANPPIGVKLVLESVCIIKVLPFPSFSLFLLATRLYRLLSLAACINSV